MAHLQAVPPAQFLTVGERLKLARERAGITVNEFAVRAEVHRNTVSRWEARFGDPGLPVIRTYAALCQNTTEEWLAFEIGAWPPLSDDDGPTDDGLDELRPRQDSNLRPSDYRSDVLPFPAADDDVELPAAA